MWVPKLARIALVTLATFGGAEHFRRVRLEFPTLVETPPPATVAARPTAHASGRIAFPNEPEPEPAPTIADKVPPPPQLAAPSLPQSTDHPASIQFGDEPAMLASAAQGPWLAGLDRFGREWSAEEGLGAPGFNARSCEACHRDPIPGGAGGAEFNVTRAHQTPGYRPAKQAGDNLVQMRELRAGLKQSRVQFRKRGLRTATHMSNRTRNRFEAGIDQFEDLVMGLQTPSLLGLGLIDAIPDEEILSREDPEDRDGDGIKGIASRVVVEGRPEVGRFGWKANVPHLADFVCLALGGENGITAPDQGRGFGLEQDEDLAADPEISQGEFDDLVYFVANLAPPERGASPNPQGEQLFTSVGCAACHVPALRSGDGRAVNLYSDLLLHELRETPKDFGTDLSPAIVARGFRTPPLWGVADTAPYMHSGRAETLRAAILEHGLEADRSRKSFENLTETDQLALIAFLEEL